MPSFSERQGLVPSRTCLQADSMDWPLRTSLWNVILRLWSAIGAKPSAHIVNSVWTGFLKKPADEVETLAGRRGVIRVWFFTADWNRVYDLLEHVASKLRDERQRVSFVAHCNMAMEKEMSAYRFTGMIIAPLTNPTELDEVDEAQEHSLPPVATHLSAALRFLSDREAPDFRNSIKESISAVEAIAEIVAGKPKATLPDALKEIAGLHPAAKAAFIKLYGYTSDEGGIRHAISDESTVDFADAKFMLVTCSAFVNFIQAKTR